MKLEKYLKQDRGAALKLAKALNVTAPAITYWIKGQIPARHVLPIFFATNHAVLPHEMRPDLYPIGLINLNSLSDSESISNEKQ